MRQPSSMLMREIALFVVFVCMAVTCAGLLIFDEVHRTAPDASVLSILTFILGVLARDFGTSGTQNAVSQASTTVARATLDGVQVGQSVNGSGSGNGGPAHG